MISGSNIIERQKLGVSLASQNNVFIEQLNHRVAKIV
jgi:hypothetical protein